MKVLLFAALLFPAASFADSLTCTIKSGPDRDSVTVDLNKPSNGSVDSAALNDLGFDLEIEKTEKSATANITIYSSILEDEAGSFSFDFDRGGKASVEVAKEPLTDTPDGEDYEISCIYTP